MRFSTLSFAAAMLCLIVASFNVRGEPAAAQSDFMWGVLVHPGNAARDGSKLLGMLEKLKVNSFRMDMKWAGTEYAKGKYAIDPQIEAFLSQAIEKGIHPLLVLCYGNPLYDGGDFPKSAEGQEAFVRYAQFVANHYKGRITLYEIWNEYNHGAGTIPHADGDPTLYAKLLAKVYQGLKDVDPHITVLGGAMARVGNTRAWTESLFKARALDSMDAFSFHPYVYPDVPEKVFDELNRYEALAKTYSNGREVPIYATEVAWPTYSGQGGVSQDAAAMYLARIFILSPTSPQSYIKGIWWYELSDGGRDPSNREHNFGLFTVDKVPKAAACAMSQVGDLLTKFTPVSAVRNTNGVWVAKFSNSSGSTFAMWTQDPAVTVTVDVSAADSRSATITARGICRESGATASDNGSLRAVISNSPTLFSTSAINLLIR